MIGGLLVPRRHGAGPRYLTVVLCLVHALAAAGARAAPVDPPTLSNGTGQFILLDPAAPAPVTPLHGLDGRPVSLAALRGKVVLLNVWATWCPPCVAEMASLDALAARYAAAGLVVVAVALDEGEGSRVRAFVAEHRLRHLRVLLDPDHRVAGLAGSVRGALQVDGLPTSYLVGRANRVMGSLTGPLDWGTPEARSFIEYFTTRE